MGKPKALNVSRLPAEILLIETLCRANTFSFVVVS
jgi:hypothetical protein